MIEFNDNTRYKSVSPDDLKEKAVVLRYDADKKNQKARHEPDRISRAESILFPAGTSYGLRSFIATGVNEGISPHHRLHKMLRALFRIPGDAHRNPSEGEAARVRRLLCKETSE